MAKGIPKRDGSGKGVGANRGRGGCDPPLDKNRRGGDNMKIRKITRKSVSRTRKGFEKDWKSAKKSDVKRKKTETKSYEKYKRKNIDTRGRILAGPTGGQWTSGKARSGPPNQQIENCGWLRRKKKE